MCPLTRWGLPNRANDDLLFGSDRAWPAERFSVTRLTEQRAGRGGGADTDVDPISDRNQVVDLTPDDEARAAILLRYRLYSRQPDEMITFMALQRMRPRQGDFDPKLYQYGGAYIYMIGGCLGLSSLLGATHLTTQLAYYLDHPEAFGAFYVVSRCLSLGFGVAALLAVFVLARRAAGMAAGWLAMLLTAACPVFITLALESKPHLPSTALLLWAIAAAWECWDANSRASWLRLGTICGLAFALVLTGAAALALPMALLLRPAADQAPRWRGPFLSFALTVVVFAFLNPYLIVNMVFKAGALNSNLGNSTSMYAVGDWNAGLQRVVELLVEGAGPLTVLIGVLGSLMCVRRNARLTILLAGPALGMIALCIAIGAGKPAEFARFLLLPCILLTVASAVGLVRLAQKRLWVSLAVGLALVLTTKTPEYLGAFVEDAGGSGESRRIAGERLAGLTADADAIAVVQEPAPYAIPPLDFAHRRIILLPRSAPREVRPGELPAWLALTADVVPPVGAHWWQRYYTLESRSVPQSRQLAQITWADKPVFIYRRIDPPR